MNRHSRRPSRAALRLALALLFPAGGAAAATFTVSTLADSGLGSLRQAVLAANAAAGADDIAFAPGLTGTITLTSDELAITGPLVVQGPGAQAITVSGGGQFRIFYVDNPAIPPIAVTLSGLSLTRGRGFPQHVFPFGGAVFANGEDLTILDSVISDSTSGFQVDPPNDGCGGNVALDGTGGGSLRIVNSLVTGGSVLGFGSESGGNVCVLRGSLTLERSTLSGGSATNGGGLFALSPEDSSILLSTISGNDAGFAGGGIQVGSSGTGGVLTVDSSTISGNTAPDFGEGGGIALFSSQMRILNSTVSGNQGGQGSGIFEQDSDLQLINSTVSGNHAQFDGGGIYFTALGKGSLLLRLTTVSGNSAARQGGSLLVASPSPASAVQLDHAIVANGSPQDLSGFGAVPATLTANYSLIEAPGTTVLVGGNNILGTDPNLGPLANNGGPTQTQRLLPGSPALDAGDPAIPSPPPADQRGAARIVGPAVDLGSVEGLLGIVEVPALSRLGLLALGASLLAAGVRRLRRAPH